MINLIRETSVLHFKIEHILKNIFEINEMHIQIFVNIFLLHEPDFYHINLLVTYYIEFTLFILYS